VAATSGQRVARARTKTCSMENILATGCGRRLWNATSLFQTTQTRFPQLDLNRWLGFSVLMAGGPNVALLACAESIPENPAPCQIFSWDVMTAAACIRHGRQSTYLVDRSITTREPHFTLTVSTLHALAAAATSQLRSWATFVCTSRSFGRKKSFFVLRRASCMPCGERLFHLLLARRSVAISRRLYAKRRCGCITEGGRADKT